MGDNQHLPTHCYDQTSTGGKCTMAANLKTPTPAYTVLIIKLELVTHPRREQVPSKTQSTPLL